MPVKIAASPFCGLRRSKPGSASHQQAVVEVLSDPDERNCSYMLIDFSCTASFSERDESADSACRPSGEPCRACRVQCIHTQTDDLHPRR